MEDSILYDKIYNMTLDEIKARKKALNGEVIAMRTPEEVDKATIEMRYLSERQEELREYQHRKAIEKAMNGNAPQPGSVAFTIANEQRHEPLGGNKMFNDNETLEVRSFQKYITSGMKNMDESEKRALAISGSAAALPVAIMNKLIENEKYSDLLHRATVIQQGGAGSIKIPIASNTAASWKLENSSVDGSDASNEASPTLTAVILTGFELYRWMRMSAAAYSMTEGNFTDLMLQLLSNEVVETLEKSFITGAGTTEPLGLDELTWTAANQKLTASSVTPITQAHIAEALSFLPQRYARNAILLCNSKMLYNISQFKGTSELAFNLSDGAKTFLGHEIVVSEHMSDDVLYWVDPRELFVRFSMPIQVEANTSSGFTAAAVDLRALAVVDAQWNPAACTAVGLGATG